MLAYLKVLFTGLQYVHQSFLLYLQAGKAHILIVFCAYQE